MQLAPNSKEWFDALAKVDPKKAEVSRAIVARAGREDVCSICGDRPARDYRVQALALTFRFCDDCRSIRTGAGEQLEPVGT